MNIKFSLEKGMSGKEILNELNGKVSGETRALYQTFATPAKNHAISLGDELHKIIATGEANGQTFAIIEKIHTYAKIDEDIHTVGETLISENKRKAIRTDRSYFLSGINDEGTYFVHPLENDSILTYWKTGSMQKVLDGVNRIVDGYSRIQGDVLTKEYNDWELIIGDVDSNGIEDVTLDEHNEHMNLVSRDMDELKSAEILGDRERGFTWDRPARPWGQSSRKMFVEAENKVFDLDTGKEIKVQDEDIQNTKRFTAVDMTREEYEKEYVKHINNTPLSTLGSKNILKNPLPIFGNHFLYTDAKKIYAGANGVLLMHPTIIALEHNEHKSVKFHPTEGKNVFLTTQRGVTAIEGKFVGYD